MGDGTDEAGRGKWRPGYRQALVKRPCLPEITKPCWGTKVAADDPEASGPFFRGQSTWRPVQGFMREEGEMEL